MRKDLWPKFKVGSSLEDRLLGRAHNDGVPRVHERESALVRSGGGTIVSERVAAKRGIYDVVGNEIRLRKMRKEDRGNR